MKYRLETRQQEAEKFLLALEEYQQSLINNSQAETEDFLARAMQSGLSPEQLQQQFGLAEPPTYQTPVILTIQTLRAIIEPVADGIIYPFEESDAEDTEIEGAEETTTN